MDFSFHKIIHHLVRLLLGINPPGCNILTRAFQSLAKIFIFCTLLSVYISLHLLRKPHLILQR